MKKFIGYVTPYNKKFLKKSKKHKFSYKKKY